MLTIMVQSFIVYEINDFAILIHPSYSLSNSYSLSMFSVDFKLSFLLNTSSTPWKSIFSIMNLFGFYLFII